MILSRGEFETIIRLSYPDACLDKDYSGAYMHRKVRLQYEGWLMAAKQVVGFAHRKDRECQGK